jgi:hypothetical protein
MHQLLIKDTETLEGTCVICGPVALTARMDRGKLRVRCSVAVDLHRKGKHGLTVKQAQRLREGKVCAICGHDDPDHLTVDHCHQSNITRDVLCHWCNALLGFSRDNPEILRRGAGYLEYWKC